MALVIGPLLALAALRIPPLVGLWRGLAGRRRERTACATPRRPGAAGVDPGVGRRGVLSGMASILLAPIIGFSATEAVGLPLLMRGLAAATVARMESVGVAFGVGLASASPTNSCSSGRAEAASPTSSSSS